MAIRKTSFTLDELEGIYKDPAFVDEVYLFGKLNRARKDHGSILPPKDTIQMILHYIAAIRRCVHIADVCTDEIVTRHYKTWLRWNKVVVEHDLNVFATLKCIREDATVFEDLRNVTSKLKAAVQRYFVFSEQDVAVANEYVHAFNLLAQRINLNKKLCIQAGNLFINYVNNLIRCGYTEVLDRKGVSFEQLGKECDLLVTNLVAFEEAELARQVKNVNLNYARFRYNDLRSWSQQSKLMAKALAMAHVRITGIISPEFERNPDEAFLIMTEKICLLYY